MKTLLSIIFALGAEGCSESGFRAAPAKTVAESTEIGEPQTVEKTPKGTVTLGDIEVISSDNETTPATNGIDSDAKCISGKGTPPIDFENLPFGINPDTYFMDSHGLRIKPMGVAKLAVRKTTRRGEANPSNSERAWKCGKCPGSPAFNRLANRYAEQRMKRGVLSAENALKDSMNGFRIELGKPVRSFSFDLVDVDGSEEWLVKAFGISNNEITTDSTKPAKSYKFKRSFNGAFKTIKIELASATISRVDIIGTKNGDRFGFAIDNIEISSTNCD